MIAEIGQLILIIALLSSALGVLALPLLKLPFLSDGSSSAHYDEKLLTLSMRSLWLWSAGSILAYILLTIGFALDDFSIAYVASHSNTKLPLYYKLPAVWGGHEGSLLLWVVTLGVWATLVSLRSTLLPTRMRLYVVSVLSFVALGFFLFMVLTSNPFDRVLPNTPMEGSDLNPQLQDPGFIFHPPMLYIGYVGFAVVFAFAIAALLYGKFDREWARWSRPWTNVAWATLTGGIALGSWWAYNELGWGGWWFWDPVENASFMPWLAGTALLHTLSMTEKRGIFKNWTLLLAITTFSLSLLGTFIVRSGVLNSVHAFASDPSRGVFILAFLTLVVGGSLLLFALRAGEVSGEKGFAPVSRESFLLANTLIFIVSTVLVLFGTLYPLVTEALNAGKISVGEPWFNLFFSKLMALAAVLSAVGIAVSWGAMSAQALARKIASPLIASALIGVLAPLLASYYSIAAAVTVFLGVWVILSCVSDTFQKVFVATKGERLARLKKLPLMYHGMIIAHIGFGILILGAGLNTIYSDQRDLRLAIDKPAKVAGLSFELKALEKIEGPNYVGQKATVVLSNNGEVMKTLYPERRRYLASGDVTTEPSIDINPIRDIYFTLADQLDDVSYSVRIQYKPFVRWIWFGAILMSIGALLAAFDSKVKGRKRKPARSAEGARSTSAQSATAVAL